MVCLTAVFRRHYTCLQLPTWRAASCNGCSELAAYVERDPLCTLAGATLLSFVAALVHFTVEVLVYKTMSLRSAANPLVIAGGEPRSYTLLKCLSNPVSRELPHSKCALGASRRVNAVDGGGVELLLEPRG